MIAKEMCVPSTTRKLNITLLLKFCFKNVFLCSIWILGIQSHIFGVFYSEVKAQLIPWDRGMLTVMLIICLVSKPIFLSIVVKMYVSSTKIQPPPQQTI